MMDGDEASAQAAQAAQQQARERRRSSIAQLAIPVCANQMAASVEIGHDQVEFEAHGVSISQDGLFIDGNNVSSVHQNDLRVLSELGRGACSVVKQAQVCRGAHLTQEEEGGFGGVEVSSVGNETGLIVVLLRQHSQGGMRRCSSSHSAAPMHQ